MDVIRLSEMQTLETPRGVQGRKLIDWEDVNVMNLVLKPGEQVPEHSTPVDVFFYVVSGKGKIQVGDEQEEVKATDIVLSPKNIPHAVFADEKEGFEILVVKTPNPKSLKKD